MQYRNKLFVWGGGLLLLVGLAFGFQHYQAVESNGAAEELVSYPTTPEPLQDPITTPGEAALAPTLTPTAPSPSPTAEQPVDIIVSAPAPAGKLLIARPNQVSGFIVPPRQVEVCVVVRFDNLATADSCTVANGQDGSWTVETAPAPQATGSGLLEVDAGQATVSLPVELIFAPDEAGSFITLNHPTPNDFAVPGHILLVDGEARNVPDGLINIGVSDCERNVRGELLAYLGLPVRNGRWYGYIGLPGNLSGETICIVAFADESYDPDSATVAWESLTEIQLRSAEARHARTLQIANPDALVFPAREMVELFGSAINTPDGNVYVDLMVGEEVLAYAVVDVGPHGLWEAELYMSGLAIDKAAYIRLRSGAGADEWEMRYPVTVEEEGS